MTQPPEAVCPGCGQRVDPLRAGHVAIRGEVFQYFCRLTCKEDYLRALGELGHGDAPTARPPAVFLDESPPPSPPPSTGPAAEGPNGKAPPGAARDASPDVARAATAFAGSPPVRRRREALLAVLDGLGMVAGVLAPAIALLGSIADVVRLPLVIGAGCALFARIALARRDPADPHWTLVAAPTGGAVVAACWAQAEHAPHAAAVAVLAGLAATSAIAVERLVARARVRVDAGRERIHRALDLRVRVIRGDGTALVPASEVRAGEQVLVEAGEIVGVDASVVAGDGRVLPWLDARAEVVKREGDPVVAGARVTSNPLRLTTTWSGRERAWMKLLSASSRIDVAAPTARAVRHSVERGALVAAALAGVAAFSANAPSSEILAAMSAAAVAFGAKAVASFVGLHFARAHLEALANGIAYKDARAFERASGTDIAVLSARGTVLLGEPEIVAVEPVAVAGRAAERAADESARVLSLAAGAETASSHPFAAAILRAARTRGVRSDHVRNATAHAGLGVTALASTGERLVVGGRAIMLEEKIGVAVADARVAELEAQGRSVLLVALGDRVIGVIALQDGLRAGARAAVQRLLDVRVEPVLLSGEARDTCETIGRALDIDHVRPEVLPGDRGAEVRALAEGGSTVAVIGHPATDDGSLGAADVAVAMSAAGSTPGEWAISLAGDDVRDAAEALALPRVTRARIWGTIGLGATPGMIALLVIGFGIAPPALAPLASLLGAIAAAVYARETAVRQA
jgi:cation transport ATPase